MLFEENHSRFFEYFMPQLTYFGILKPFKVLADNELKLSSIIFWVESIPTWTCLKYETPRVLPIYDTDQ